MRRSAAAAAAASERHTEETSTRTEKKRKFIAHLKFLHLQNLFNFLCHFHRAAYKDDTIDSLTHSLRTFPICEFSCRQCLSITYRRSVLHTKLQLQQHVVAK